MHWARENNYYSPLSVVSQRGGVGAQYALTTSNGERVVYSISRSGVLITGIRQLMRDVILPNLEGQGVPPSVVSFVEENIETTMRGVERLLIVAEEEQVVGIVVPDDVSALD